MRLIVISLAALLLLIQYPLWLGKGGWLRSWELEKQLQVAQKRNEDLKARNAKLESEVSDLKQGTGAVEERARFELGMIKDDEVFIQVVDPNSTSPFDPDAVRKIPRLPDPGAAAQPDTIVPGQVRPFNPVPPKPVNPPKPDKPKTGTP